MLRHSLKADWLDSAEFFSHHWRVIHLSSGNTPSFSPTSESSQGRKQRERERVLSKKLPLFRSFRPSWRRQTFLDGAFRAFAYVVAKEYPHTLTRAFLRKREEKGIQHTFSETIILLSKKSPLMLPFIKWSLPSCT